MQNQIGLYRKVFRFAGKSGGAEGLGTEDKIVLPGDMAEIEPLQRRLKSLDEFEPPEFVGRVRRIERRRNLVWWAMLSGAVALGAVIGLALF